jgi:hypothetical protein
MRGSARAQMTVSVWPSESKAQSCAAIQPIARVSCFSLGFLDAAQLTGLSKVVAASGFEASKSARRFLELPKDGHAIRARGQTRCWYDTGCGGDTGLADIAKVALRLEMKSSVRVTLEPKERLP